MIIGNKAIAYGGGIVGGTVDSGTDEATIETVSIAIDGGWRNGLSVM